MSELVFLNGKFLPRDQALISADDRGFQFADGVYEVIKYYGGNPFRMEAHLERLRHSLGEVQIRYPGLSGLTAIFKDLLAQNGLQNKDAAVYLQISRGTHPRVHHFPGIPEPTVYAFAFPFPSFTTMLKEGIRVITAEDIRWLRCDIKSVSLLPNTMLYQKAVEHGTGECILIRDGVVTEATHSSVFGIRDGTLFTHPLSNLILPGITRAVVLEICREHAIPCLEEPIANEVLARLDEVFLTGTGSEVMPVVQVNETIIGNGEPGILTRFLQERFFEKVKVECL